MGQVIQFPGRPRTEAETKRQEQLAESIKKLNELIAAMRREIQK